MAVVAEETGLRNFYDLKRAWEKCAGKERFRERENLFMTLVKGNVVKTLVINKEVYFLSSEIMDRYKLLSNDVLVSVVCEYYGISKLATFDKDFKRVDF